RLSDHPGGRRRDGAGHPGSEPERRAAPPVRNPAHRPDGRHQPLWRTDGRLPRQPDAVHRDVSGAVLVSDRWPEAAIEELVSLLQPDEAVRALALFGTAARQPDIWSDVDLLLVVDEAAWERFHPALDWLRPLGELYAWDQSAGPWTSVTRACFT